MQILDSVRRPVSAIVLSAAGLVGIVGYEGYSPVAVAPVAGDVCTEGFGTTVGVKCGDKSTPQKALSRALIDVDKDTQMLRGCIKVPMYQREFDAYSSLAYNIGSGAFCSSTLVIKLNALDYEGACKEILRWDRFKGKPLVGLAKRRQSEYQTCIGASQ